MKTVLISGGSRGLGGAFRLFFRNERYRVATFSRTIEEEESTDYIARQVDVTDHDSVQRFVECVIGRWGPIHVLINNAGVALPVSVDLLQKDDWDRTISTNLSGAYYLIKTVIADPPDRDNVLVINISSIAGIASGGPGSEAYTASKFGLQGLSEVLFEELVDSRVRITNLILATLRNKDNPRGIKPSDVVDIVEYLVEAPSSMRIKNIEIHAL